MTDSKNTSRSSWDDVLDLYKKDVDLGLLRAQLEKSPEERLAELQRLADFADEIERAGAEVFRD